MRRPGYLGGVQSIQPSKQKQAIFLPRQLRQLYREKLVLPPQSPTRFFKSGKNRFSFLEQYLVS